jgi:hypothetical protein
MPVNDRTRVSRCAAPNYSCPIQINHRGFLGGFAPASRLSAFGKALTAPKGATEAAPCTRCKAPIFPLVRLHVPTVRRVRLVLGNALLGKSTRLVSFKMERKNRTRLGEPKEAVEAIAAPARCAMGPYRYQATPRIDWDFDELRHLWIHWKIAILDVFGHNSSYAFGRSAGASNFRDERRAVHRDDVNRRVCGNCNATMRTDSFC